MLKKIDIIINPVSGADEPILSIINNKLHKKNIQWNIRVTQKKEDIAKYVKQAIENSVDAIAIYGGDGSVTEAAEHLHPSLIPLIILPGGTANVLAKELKIPLTAAEMLDLLVKKKIKIKKIDMGLLNKKPFFLRVSYGLLADMIVETDKNLKKTIGQFAYGVAAIKKLAESKMAKYTITIGEKKFTTEGVSLMIANSANIGISGLSLLKKVDMSDGKLDIFLVKNTNFTHITSLLAGAFTGNKPVDMDHWQGKKIKITVSPRQRILCDDSQIKIKEAIIEIIPHAVSLVVPK